MKLKINKAYDLNSISVLPPHSRRPSAMSQASQIQTQSQPSFSQGMSQSQPQSQLSQSSFEENPMNDQGLESQERERSTNRIPSSATGMGTRDESQLQLARISNRAVRRWSSASVPDNRCQASERLENGIQHMEGSLNRLGLILDSVQSDVMQVNRAVKEVALETEGIRRKISLLENSMGQVIKEEGLKSIIDATLKSILEKILESDRNNLNEIAQTISGLPKQIESYIVKLQHEVCTIIAEKIEVVANGMKPSHNCYEDSVLLPKSKSDYSATLQSQKNQIPIPLLSPFYPERSVPASTVEAETPKVLKPKITGSNDSVPLVQEEIPLPPKEKAFRIIIDADEESDGDLSCLFLKKETVRRSSRFEGRQPETVLQRAINLQMVKSLEAKPSTSHGKASYSIEEANKETLRILRKARKRKRKRDNCVILD